MYEPEVNRSVESIAALPPEVRARFAEYRERIASRTMLPWGEHCTECVWPTCYTTCNLYAPRPDGGCRQFVEGMVRLDHPEGLNPYVLRLRFKQWAKLWAKASLRLYSLQEASRRESFHIAVGALARNTPLPGSLGPRLLRKVNYLRKRAAAEAAPAVELPDSFLLEGFNPGQEAVTITFTVRSSQSLAPYQQLLEMTPGFARHTIAAREIFRGIDPTRPFEIELVPNHQGDTTLYFGLMDFVKEVPQRLAAAEPKPAAPAGVKAPRLKCLVWDLDNTLWDGTLVEDGAGRLRIRPAVVALIKAADERGILNSVASKNNHDDALQVLRDHGLEEYFLFPQIQWRPKSQSLHQIAQELNIGIDSLALIDDQAFEREEVKAELPQATVIDAADLQAITARPEWQELPTEESRNRRAMYREQERRQDALASYQGDYVSFLRNCQMEMTLAPLDPSSLQRVYELAQRTNQLNFSGRRYEEKELQEILGRADRETYVITCADRFGVYGIVGFGVVDVEAPRLLDLMFSCRVQGKHVEHAFLAYLLNRFAPAGTRDFFATYRKTAKNTPAGKVFEEAGFEPALDADPTALVFRRGRALADEGVVRIHSHLPEPSVRS